MQIPICTRPTSMVIFPAASMAAMPAMGLNAIFPVLLVIALACAVVGLVHPMKALVAKKDGAAAQS